MVIKSIKRKLNIILIIIISIIALIFIIKDVETINYVIDSPDIKNIITNNSPIYVGENITFFGDCNGLTKQLVICKRTRICNNNTEGKDLLCRGDFTNENKVNCTYKTKETDIGINSNSMATCCDENGNCDTTTVLVEDWKVSPLEMDEEDANLYLNSLKTRLESKPHYKNLIFKNLTKRVNKFEEEEEEIILINVSDLEIEFKNTENGKIIIYGIKDINSIEDIQLSEIDQFNIMGSSKYNINTDIIAVNSIDFENAEITLSKKGNVNAILKCDDWNFETSTCNNNNWIITDIPFVDDEESITFIVNSFSAYAGGVIEITRAEHLNSNREFISDIYNETKTKDNIWSETIPNGDYVRVTFEMPLDNTRDITLYPRIVSGTPKIEVYEIDGTELIAEFTNIISNEYNKVFLTNLQGTQDVFDLKILGGDIEIDHIIDPQVTIETGLYDGDDEDAPGSRVVFINDTHGYVFYQLSRTASVSYKKTTDGGATWGSNVDMTGGVQKTFRSISVWYDRWTPDDTGTKIHISANGYDNDVVEYCYLDTADDSRCASWVTAFGGGGAYNSPNMATQTVKSTIGYLFFSSADPTGGHFMGKSTDNGVSWGSDMSPNYAWMNDGDDHSMLLPLANGDILLIYHDTSGGTLYSLRYNETSDSWDADGNQKTIVTGTGFVDYICPWGATYDRDTHEVYLVVNNQINNAAADLVFYKYTSATNSWSSAVDIYTNIGVGNTDIKIAIDENTKDLYAVYSRGTTFKTVLGVYVKNSTDGGSNWGDEIKISESADDDIWFVSINLMSDEYIYAVWINQNLNDLFGKTIINLTAATVANKPYFYNITFWDNVSNTSAELGRQFNGSFTIGDLDENELFNVSTFWYEESSIIISNNTAGSNMSNYTSAQINGTMKYISWNLTSGNYRYGYNYSLGIYVCDADGCNQSNSTTLFINDTGAPEIYLYWPPNNTLNDTANWINFTFNTTDVNTGNSGIDNCTLWINNIVNRTETNPLDDITKIQNITTYLPGSEYMWKISCTDKNNNINTSESENISINTNDPPTQAWNLSIQVGTATIVNETTATNKYLLSTHDFTPIINWTNGTDSDGNQIDMFVCILSNPTNNICDVYSTWTNQSNLTNFPGLNHSGKWYINITTNDGIINGTTYSTNFTINNTLPVISGSALNGNDTHDNTPTLTWTVTDSDDGSDYFWPADSIVDYILVGESTYGDNEYLESIDGTGDNTGETVTTTLPWATTREDWTANRTFYARIWAGDGSEINGTFYDTTIGLYDNLPNITGIFMCDDNTLEDCNVAVGSQCSLQAVSHNNVSNLIIQINATDKDNDCDTSSSLATLYLCNKTSGACDENNYDFNFTLTTITKDSNDNRNCSYEFASTQGPTGTPQFYIPGSTAYLLQVNISSQTGQAPGSIKEGNNNATWWYKNVTSVNYTGNIIMGDGTININTWNPGTNQYNMTNWGNVILNLKWNISAFYGPNADTWNMNGTDLEIDDDAVRDADTGNLAARGLNATNYTFVFGTGLNLCVDYACTSPLKNETMATHWHIYPPTGLATGIYYGNLTYRIFAR